MKNEKFYEKIGIISIIIILLIFTHLCSFGLGKYKAKSEFRCTIAQCLQYK